jgi:hypothetical protein
MDFWFEFLNIQMNEKIITCHDYHGFKWQNINIYQILTNFSLRFDAFFCSLDYDCTLKLILDKYIHSNLLIYSFKIKI